MGTFIDVTDLEPFADIAEAKAEGMIEDAEAQAVLTAPCLPGLADAPPDESPEDAAKREAKLAAVKSILRAAILRWNEAGTGAIQTQAAGPFSTAVQFQARRSMFWPTEIEQLQSICATEDKAKAFSVDTIPGGTGHLPWCSLAMGATYCSCGADIAGYPIYGVS